MAVAVIALLVACGAGLPFVSLRLYSRRLRSRRMEKADKLHRLNRATTLVVSICVAGMTAATIALGNDVLGDSARDSSAGQFAFVGGLVLSCIAVMVGALGGMFPLYRELRELEQSPRSAIGRQLRVSLIVFLPLTFLFVAMAAVPDSLEHNRLAIWAIRLGVFLVLFASTPIWIVRAFGRSDIDPDLRKDLIDFSSTLGVRPRDIRAIEGRQGKEANAMFVGILPRHRYILITDYLIDKFSRNELKAVVAHELGHAREHHLIVFLGAFFGASLVGVAGQLLLAHVEAGWATAIGVVVMSGSLAAMWWAGWFLWLRFEYRADAFAARAVGVDTTVAALEKLAEVNMTPRRTGRFWNLLNRHPSIEQRVERLRQAHETTRRSDKIGRPGAAAL